MKTTLQYGLFRIAFWIASLWVAVSAVIGSPARAADETATAHAYGFTSIEGEPMPMAGFAGKALLVVNTASFCGFTHQYEGLQALWERYRDRGFVLVGVPSNDFGGQEPGSVGEIKTFCEVRYGIDFPMTEKARVRGVDAHPLYRWLKTELGAGKAPRWNFHKYLIGPDGRAVEAFATHVRPDDRALLAAIEAVLPATH